MENFWQLGRWLGVPAVMHWTVLLAFPWLYLMFGSFAEALIGTAAVIALHAVHELGHAALARWRGVYVEGVVLTGLHGQTTLGLMRTQRDEVLIAWGGVLAQALLLIVTLLLENPLMQLSLNTPLLGMVLSPITFVFTRWNIFLMLVALLPIGPMDGHLAWQALRMLRQKLRRRGPRSERDLSPEQRRALEEKSRKIAADVISKLGKNRAGKD